MLLNHWSHREWCRKTSGAQSFASTPKSPYTKNTIPPSLFKAGHDMSWFKSPTLKPLARRRWKVSLPSSKVLGTGCDSNVSAKGGVIAQHVAHHHGASVTPSDAEDPLKSGCSEQLFVMGCLLFFFHRTNVFHVFVSIWSNLVQGFDYFWLEGLRMGLGEPCGTFTDVRCDGMLYNWADMVRRTKSLCWKRQAQASVKKTKGEIAALAPSDSNSNIPTNG